MMNYIGSLAILKGKEHPSLVLNITEEYNFCDNFSVSNDGNFIFLQPSLYEEGCRYVKPILIIDLDKQKFSYVLTGVTAPSYKIKQNSDCVFGVEADESRKNGEKLQVLHGKELRIDELKWYSIKKIHSLPKMIFKKKR